MTAILIRCLLLTLALFVAQDPPAAEEQPAPAPEVSKELIDQLKTELEALGDDDVAQTALGLLTEAEKSLQAQQGFKTTAGELERKRLGAKGEIETIRAELAEATETRPKPERDATIEQLEGERDQAEASLKTAQDKLTKVQGEKTRRQTRRTEIPTRKEQINTRLEELKGDLATPAAEDEQEALTRARRYKLLAEQLALTTELAALDAESKSYDARIELLPLREQRWSARVAARQALLEGI
jgi:chromosome segregation ATPase